MYELHVLLLVEIHNVIVPIMLVLRHKNENEMNAFVKKNYEFF